MTELSLTSSFIIRVYRVDTDDSSRITGLLEAMDGSGTCVPFTNIGELGVLIRNGSDRRALRRGKAKSSLKIKE